MDAGFDQELQRVRTAGLAWVVDEAVVGVSAVAAPVFDATGRIVLAITAIGHSASLDARPTSSVGQALHTCAMDLTRATGGLPPA
jgi:DNA-binding IclR family transcriptional regulator